MNEEEILRHGTRLEALGFSDSQIDDYFEHHGVKGMHWGIRQGKNKTGISRSRAATIDRNKRMIRIEKNIRDRTGSKTLRVLSAPDRILMGKKLFEKFHNKRINALEDQNKRIASGNLFVRDRLAALGNSPIDLILERKPTTPVKAAKATKAPAKKAPKKLTNQQANQKVGAFLKTHPNG